MHNKPVTNGYNPNQPGLPADFNKQDFEGALGTKGYEVIHEKAYLCPCKSKESDHRNVCKNCGGTGWLYANPLRTNMVITGIMSDNAFKQGALEGWDMLDTGSVKITSYNEQKLSQMDKISILDATGEHNELLYPVLSDDQTKLFAFTKYDIKSIDYIALFQSATAKLKRLIEGTDFTFENNIIVLAASYNVLTDACVTIRYVYNPIIYVTSILRESMTSPALQATQKLILPVLAIGMRAHLLKDRENLQGTLLLDNSWKVDACAQEDLTKFQRQLKYSSVQTIFDNLTPQQKQDLDALLDQSF